MLKLILILISKCAAIVYEKKTEDALGNTYDRIPPLNFAAS